jgi:hypothetical protein
VKGVETLKLLRSRFIRDAFSKAALSEAAGGAVWDTKKVDCLK